MYIFLPHKYSYQRRLPAMPHHMKLKNLVLEASPAHYPSFEFDGRYYEYERLTNWSQHQLSDMSSEFPSIVGDLVISNYPQLASLNEIGKIEEVKKDLQIHQCKNFTDLASLPVRVGGVLSLSECDGLVSLQGINSRLKHAGRISIDNSKPDTVKSHVLGLLLIHVDAPFYFSTGKRGDNIAAVSESVLNRYRNGGRRGVIAAQRDLIKLGLKEYAQL